LAQLLEEVCGEDEANDLSHRWFTNKAIRRSIERRLRQYGLSSSAAEVRAFELKLGELSTVERIVADLIVRRDKMYRQIQDYRTGLATIVTDAGVE